MPRGCGGLHETLSRQPACFLSDGSADLLVAGQSAGHAGRTTSVVETRARLDRARSIPDKKVAKLLAGRLRVAMKIATRFHGIPSRTVVWQNDQEPDVAMEDPTDREDHRQSFAVKFAMAGSQIVKSLLPWRLLM